MEEDIDELLKTAIKVVPQEVISDPEGHHRSGTVGWWDGPLGEHKVGVVLDSSTLQLYRSSRLGFIPDGIPSTMMEWKLSESIANFRYEIRYNGILYLII